MSRISAKVILVGRSGMAHDSGSAQHYPQAGRGKRLASVLPGDQKKSHITQQGQ